MRLSSVEPPRARASGLESPMLVLSATLPCRPVAPAAKRRASARLVLPAPPGPTSAIFLVPGALVGILVSFVRLHGSAKKTRPRALLETFSFGLSAAKRKGVKGRFVACRTAARRLHR